MEIGFGKVIRLISKAGMAAQRLMLIRVAGSKRAAKHGVELPVRFIFVYNTRRV